MQIHVRSHTIDMNLDFSIDHIFDDLNTLFNILFRKINYMNLYKINEISRSFEKRYSNENARDHTDEEVTDQSQIDHVHFVFA